MLIFSVIIPSGGGGEGTLGVGEPPRPSTSDPF